MKNSSIKTLNYVNDRDFAVTSSVATRVFSKALVFCTLLLILAGSFVTSTGSGLSVPDWPSTYGQFMFAFPLKDMVGGIFYEHGHRMIATVVGFLTLVMAIVLAFTQEVRWLRNLGLLALAAVVAQGLLGGLTVLFFLPTPVSVAHAMLAQTFFCITMVIAYSLSKERRFRSLNSNDIETCHRSVVRKGIVFTLSVYVQLLMGAIMRHTQSGLAIPDFPTMGGRWLPMMDESMLAWINAWRFEQLMDPVGLTNVWFHLMHRFGAVMVVVCFLVLFVSIIRHKSVRTRLLPLALVILGLVVLQVTLGVMTVLSMKQMWFTSFHVMTGALILAFSVLLLLRSVPVRLIDFRKMNSAASVTSADGGRL